MCKTWAHSVDLLQDVMTSVYMVTCEIETWVESKEDKRDPSRVEDEVVG